MTTQTTPTPLSSPTMKPPTDPTTKLPTTKLPTVLITGCSTGTIGHSLALTFATTQHNYHVFASARRLSSMTTLAHIPNITLLELDITSADSVRRAHDLISQTTGGTLDILYHNAGVRAVKMALETDTESARWMLDANFVAVVGMTSVFGDLLLSAARTKGGSRVVFTSSVAGRVPAPSNAVYSASKAALDMYADTLRAELRPLGVSVVSVVTGDVETAMSAQKMEELAEDSPYKAIESIINDAWTERKGIMKVDDYAEAVVKKVVQQRPPEQIWEGSNATLVWWIEKLGLSWILPIILSRRFGLNKLASRSA